MESLRRVYHRLISEIQVETFRYLYDQINWSNRLIGILGARGLGKTTLILQHIKQTFPDRDMALYVSLDNIWFSKNSLWDLAEEFHNYGGRHLFIDEVHRYKDWSVEIKNIYDSYPDMKIVFTGSSILEVYRSQADLSRRLVSYHLQGLSFREYLRFEEKLVVPRFTLEDILTKHQVLAEDISKKVKILAEFRSYLKYGYYPFYNEGIKDFSFRLQQVINLIIDNDLPAVQNIEYGTQQKIKKLLLIIAGLAPYSPNISSLSEDIVSNRNATLKYLEYLQKAALLRLVYPSTTTMGAMQKPEKIFLDNSNLLFSLVENANIGNVRETFFANQLAVHHQFTSPQKGDFRIGNKFLFEVGGKSKGYKQIAKIKQSFIAADDIEIGYGNKIPLWLFGFLY